MSRVGTLGLALLLSAARLDAIGIGGATLVPAQSEARLAERLRVRPDRAWSRLPGRLARREETWTLHGARLDALRFYAGLPPGTALLPGRGGQDGTLPRFAASMGPSEVIGLFDSTMRLGLDTPLFILDRAWPAKFAGQPGFGFAYRLVRSDAPVLELRGEALGAIIEGRLYLIVFEAPAQHYYEAGLAAARQVMASARLVAAPAR
ncbi:hypothetical protein [Sphingomonas morindae]|uniref:Uncharacterized protein n=1 Tax=Sphingomonas morindae TaxID=1541170 RepID=A0ABY4X8F4_9SPHN|nr:hypothetical protein [Sphingomonas morindae]USI73202.1 hypothetical protein LHA26_01605 [Sphingomonas morindae]